MSRIGKLPITIPSGVTVTVNGNKVDVKGPKGNESVVTKGDIVTEVKGNEVVLTRKNDERQNRAFHGLYRQLINNAIIGVSQGFKKVLIINGVGYKAEEGKGCIILSLGYATQIEYMIPEGIKITLEGNGKIIIEGVDKVKVGQTASEIRSLRGPEPYKGKGIKYEDETIRRKVGKSGGKK